MCAKSLDTPPHASCGHTLLHPSLSMAQVCFPAGTYESVTYISTFIWTQCLAALYIQEIVWFLCLQHAVNVKLCFISERFSSVWPLFDPNSWLTAGGGCAVAPSRLPQITFWIWTSCYVDVTPVSQYLTISWMFALLDKTIKNKLKMIYLKAKANKGIPSLSPLSWRYEGCIWSEFIFVSQINQKLQRLQLSALPGFVLCKVIARPRLHNLI